MKSTIASSAFPEMRLGCTNPSRASVVSGESLPSGSDATSCEASLTAFTSFPFARPGCTECPWMVTRTDFAENVSTSSWPRSEPSSVYAAIGAEAVDVEVLGAATHLLVDRERDADRHARPLRMTSEIRDRGHDLGDPRLVVGAQERRAVARHEVVTDTGRQRLVLGRIEDLAWVARERDGLSVPRFVHDRRHARTRHVR